MGCPCGTTGWDAYLACAAAYAQPLVDDSVLQQYCASAGCSSSGTLSWTICVGVANLKARRLLYWKVTPGDCGSNAFDVNSSSAAGSLGLRTAASADPEPISKSILTGLASVFGGFTAAHQQAVVNEETVMCQVVTNYNAAATQIEQAVKQGALSPDQASALIQQVEQQLQPALKSITKTSGDLAAGMTHILSALVNFNSDIVYAALAPNASIPGLSVLTSSPAAASPGAPGSTGIVPNYPVPAGSTISPSPYGGASGPTATPLNANNPGVGPTSNSFLNAVTAPASGISGLFSNPLLIILLLVGLVAVAGSSSRRSEAA